MLKILHFMLLGLYCKCGCRLLNDLCRYRGEFPVSMKINLLFGGSTAFHDTCECFPVFIERRQSDITDDVVSCLIPVGIGDDANLLIYECCQPFPLLAS